MIIDKTVSEKLYFDMIKKKEATLADGYYIEDDKLFFIPCPYHLDSEWNKEEKKWDVIASLEEQKNYYLNESLKIGKKMEEYKNIGLQGGQEYIDLEKELEVNKNKYIELCHVEALEMNSILDNTN